MSNLIIFPANKKKQQDIPTVKLATTLKEKIRHPEIKLKARVPTEEEKKFKAFETLRKARADEKYLGRRLKRKRGEGFEEERRSSKKKRSVEDD